MSARTIIKIVLVGLLIYVAGGPLGQLIAAIGGFMVKVGNEIALIGLKLHGG